jgi:ABC-type branched-subunit amino acid transport system ATPase component
VRENLEMGGYVVQRGAARSSTRSSRLPQLARKRRRRARCRRQRQILAMAMAL